MGSALCDAWLAIDPAHRVVIQTRYPERYDQGIASESKVKRYVYSIDQLESSVVLDGVVNLAGLPIAEKRWTTSYKQALEKSRVELTEKLILGLQRRQCRLNYFISASAIGYYGVESESSLDESCPQGKGFAAELCRAWEQQADAAESITSRLVKLRLGVVIGRAGALKKLLPLYKLGLGGPIGKGKQWFSWVHIEDAVSCIVSSIVDQRYSGTYNLTAPNPVTQKVFAKTLGEVLKRPAFFPTPGLMLKMVFGQMAEELLLSGQRVMPVRLMAQDFEFRYPELSGALRKTLN